MVNKFNSLINYHNNYSTWELFRRHWQRTFSDREIINQIMIAALTYPDTCAACRWGIPCGWNYRDLLNAKDIRTCLCGYTHLFKDVRRGCIKFIEHNRFRLWLEAKGLSRQELADLVGRPRDTVTQYCLGNRNPSPGAARLFAKVLKIKVEDLIGGNYER